VSQAVRNFLPVIEAAPVSEAAKILLAISSAVEQLVVAHDRKCVEHAKQSQEKQAGAPEPEVTLPLLTSTRAETDAPPSPHASITTGGTDVVQNIGRAVG